MVTNYTVHFFIQYYFKFIYKYYAVLYIQWSINYIFIISSNITIYYLLFITISIFKLLISINDTILYI